MRKIILSLLAISYFSFADNIKQDVDETMKNIQKMKEGAGKTYKSDTGNINTKIDDNTKKDAENMLNQMHKNMDKLIEDFKSRIDYDAKTGKLIIRDLPNVDINSQKKMEEVFLGKNKYLEPSDRLYIFISSSIPKSVLIEYAKQIVGLKLQNRSVMVIRGCVGGCTYIKPTLNWISDIVHENGKNKDGLPVQIWIDPLLFRMYGIKQVPCVVFAENVITENVDLSEGLGNNLKTTPKYAISCGDWNLMYHIEQLYRKTNNPKLKAILEDRRR